MIKNPYKGKFICVEGIDGSGKSKQFEMLHDELVAKHDINVVFTKEPTGDSIGRTIYAILERRHKKMKLEDMTELDMQRLYFQNRRSHYQDLVLPSLRGGVNVISDRGVASVAYGLKNVNDLDRFLSVESAMFDAKSVSFIVPDLILIYDVSVDIAFERLDKKGNERDLFEQREKLKQTRSNYLAIAKVIPNCVVVDGTASAEEVFKVTREKVFSLLGIS